MRASLSYSFNLFVLATVLAGAGVVSAALRGVSHAPHAATRAYPARRPKGGADWRLISQAGSPAIKERGETIYQGFCSACHGATRAGVPSVFPSLIDVSKRQSDAEIASQIRHGKGRMLAFPDMSDEDMKALLLFLKTPPESDSPKPLNIGSTRRRARLASIQPCTQPAYDPGHVPLAIQLRARSVLPSGRAIEDQS